MRPSLAGPGLGNLLGGNSLNAATRRRTAKGLCGNHGTQLGVADFAGQAETNGLNDSKLLELVTTLQRENSPLFAS